MNTNRTIHTSSTPALAPGQGASVIARPALLVATEYRILVGRPDEELDHGYYTLTELRALSDCLREVVASIQTEEGGGYIL